MTKSRRKFNRGGVARGRESERVEEDKEERLRFTIQQKIQIVEYLMVRMDEDLASMNVVADELGVSTSSLSRWMNKLPIYRHIAKNDQVRFSLSTGRRGQLEDISAELFAFVEDLRENGYSVSRKMIVVHACRVLGPDSTFSLKTYAARAQSVSRWMAKNDLTIRTGTHQAQAHPQTVASAALDFIINIARPAVSPDLPYRHRNFIINMDQTPVFFSMHPTKSVDKVGTRTVNIRIAKNGSQRATVAVCFTASGIQLPSLVIFKGKESDKGGKIIRDECASYPAGAIYATQEKAWMSESLMMMWIQKILKPYVDMAPEGIIPLLFLDSYGVHKMGSVNRAINNLGVQVIIIPPGCTGVTQPVDVGYNKPFKGLVRDKYEEWMVKDSEDLSKPPRRVDIARWIVQSEREMKPATLCNAWMRHDLEYFPRASTAVNVPMIVNVPMMVEENNNVVSEIDDVSDEGQGDPGC